MNTEDCGNNTCLPEQWQDQIAIVGMAGRFPGADNIDSYWQNLLQGLDSLTEFDRDTLLQTVPKAWLDNPDFVKAGHVISDIDRFDANFFNYTPRQAEQIDPQQRLFLQCAWEALENAGYAPDDPDNATGVFASCGLSTYLFNLCDRLDMTQPLKYFQLLMANDKDYLATRVAYKLNLKGPAMLVQTACSSSLVAACMASQSLLDYQCDMALVGGASVNVPQQVGYMNEASNEGLSQDSRCRAFDAQASGMAYGNGLGVVVMKRLADAVRDGDTVYATIKGFATNNDGSDKVGFSALSVKGQVNVIREALEMADVEPDSIDFIEAHGTGTKLGDPIEVRALTEAFACSPGQHCAIGSVKSNIGHLNTAAGVASLIKTALSIYHRQLPASVNFSHPNPEIDFDASPFYVNTELRALQGKSGVIRAGVSSFGLGGTNAHMVLEEFRPAVLPADKRRWHLLPLSARTAQALDSGRQQLADFLRRTPELRLADVAHTLQVGRSALEMRQVIIARDNDEAVKLLEQPDSEYCRNGQVQDRFEHATLAFMFPGAGVQHVNMGRTLYEHEAVFKQALLECAGYLQQQQQLDLIRILYPSDEQMSFAQQAMQEPVVGLLSLFSVSYATARLWQSWSVQPDAMIGHSIGEYVAATLAGVFSLQDALRIVARRAELIADSPPGAMMTVLASEEQLTPLLPPKISIGAVNGPTLCMVAGGIEQMAECRQVLAEHNIRTIPIAATRAGHSPLLEPVLAEFATFLTQFTLSAPTCPFVSNLTGTWIEPRQATDPQYWVRHLRETVRFSAGIECLLADPGRLVLEVGPGNSLSTLTKRHLQGAQKTRVHSSLPMPEQESCELLSITRTLGELWIKGLAVDWKNALYRQSRRIALPTYAFERQRYWQDRPDELDDKKAKGAMAAIMDKQDDFSKWFFAPSWRRHSDLVNFARLAQYTPSTWLVLADTLGLTDRLIAELRKKGHRVVKAEQGSQFKRTGEDSFVLRAAEQADFDLLFADLSDDGLLPKRIVYAWAVSRDFIGATDSASLAQAQALGYHSLLALVRSLPAPVEHDEPIALGVVSSHLYQVNGDEPLSPAMSTLLGPVKVIPSEFRHIHCVSIDIPTDGSISLYADALVREVEIIGNDLVTTQRPPTAIAYRGQYRWEQGIESVTLPQTQPVAGLRKQGVYLITGGLGGVPMVLADYLAKHWQARLILTCRTRLPQRKEWATWLANHDEQDKVSLHIRNVMKLEDAGASVLVMRADVTDLAAMQTVCERAKREFGQIHGVFHAASMATSSMIMVQTPERAARVLGPKVSGTLVLDSLFAGQPLDFMLLFSSIASYLCALGHADYTAANIFMDTFALEQRRQAKRPYPVLSVNWGYWHGVGIGLELIPKLREFIGADVPIDGILPQEGIEALLRALAGGLAQVVVSSSDFAYLVARFQQTSKASLNQYEQFSAKQQSHDRPDIGIAYQSAQNDLQQTLVDIWQELLGIRQIGIHDGFLELGGDSLQAMPMVTRIKETLKFTLPIRVIFTHPTVAKLAQYISSQQGGECERIAAVVQKVRRMNPDMLKSTISQLEQQGD